MRKTTKSFKQFLAMTLSMAMLVAELPMTVSAAQAEGTVEESYTVTEPSTEEIDTETEVQSEEMTENEKTSLTSTANERSEEPESETENDVQMETGSEDTEEPIESASSQEETTESESVDESTDAEEEQTEITESAADLTVSSASDFVISDGVLTSYTGTDADVVIPEGVVTIKADAFKNNTTIKTVRFSSTVTTIGNNAFYGCRNLKSINFSSSVRSIGAYAFYGCSSLGPVDLNEGLETIGNSAFAGAALGEKLSTGALNLGTLTIPGTVQSIGCAAFYQCEYLGTVIFADDGTAALEIGSVYYGTFSSCPELTKITLPKRLKNISDYAFMNNPKLNEVVLGDEVETIGGQAFSGCGSLKNINFPSSVRTIGARAFYNCGSLGPVDLKEGLVTIGEQAFYGAALGEKLATGKVELGTLTIPSTVQSIGAGAFYNCAYLGTVIFADGDTVALEIGSVYYGTFSSCPELTKITLPKRLKNISDYAFMNNPKLNEVVLGDEVETIGGQAFSGCGSLKNINFPSSVRTIGARAFYNCGSLGPVDLKEGLVTIGEQAFYGAALGEKLAAGKVEPGILTIPSTVQSIGAGAFTNCAYLGTVIFADGDTVVLTMEDSLYSYGTFASCPELTKVMLPSRLTNIPSGAFSKNEKLSEVILGEKIETIGASAFFGCSSLKNIKFPSSVRTIGASAFFGCSSLDKIELSEGLVTIGDEAFRNNTNLNEVILGEKTETIGASAFSGCSSLKSIKFPSSVRTIGNSAFYKCSSLGKVELNEGLISIGEQAFDSAALGEKLATGKVELGTLTIPSTVQSIGMGAFYNCAYLGTVIFANGDTVALEIDTGSAYLATFEFCPELTTVILPERITKLEAKTFYNDQKLQTLYIPENVTEIANYAILNCPNLTIYGVSGSMAEAYAKYIKVPFKSKDDLNIGLEVQSVTLTPSFIEEIGEDVIGKKIQLSAKVLPDTAQNKEVVYQSDKEAVATVNKDGLVTINGYGETTITVTTVDGGKRAECQVVILKEAKDERPDIADASVLFPKNTTAYSAIYTGEQIRPVMTVSYQYKDDKGSIKTQKLKLNVDYTVFYSNNVNAGENAAKVTVRGIGEYTGAITKEFTIRPKSISGVMLSSVGDIVFGEKPSVTVTDGTHELVEDKDYSVVLSATGSAGTDTPSVLTVKGIGNYTDYSKKSAKFNILKVGTEIRSIASESIRVEFKKLPTKGYTYNGKAQKPGIVVTDTTTGKKLSSSEYKVIYTNNVNAGKGTAKAWVIGVSKNGKGYYGISAPLSFDINQKDFSKISASLSGTIPKAGSLENIKKAIDEAITVKDGKHVLSELEYTVDYGNITKLEDIQIGTKYPITLTPKADGNYITSSKKTIFIKFGQLNLASKTANVSVRITDASKGELTLRYNGILLVKDRDYTAVIKQDKNKGTYTVKIKAVKSSAYKGSRTVKNLTIPQ